MGQRLVISIKQHNEEIAAIYYHWSAYTASSIYEIAQLVDFYMSDSYDFGAIAKSDA